mmetsp:Transcript_7095/g.20780  ORF Transcript_7095/g.20780 Transcript_7095/m.20780 type:complete len:522 (-) Transcript_7095:3668-5233(-)
MDRSIFATLTAGIRFNKKRPRQPAALTAPPPGQAVRQPLEEEDEEPVATNDPNEADNALRKRHRIRVKGSGRVPPPLRSWHDLAAVPGCPPGLVPSLQGGLGCAAPTPIQRQAVPVLLAGRELLAVAPTGSGKTLAYLIPLVMSLTRRRYQSRVAAKAAAAAAAEDQPGTKRTALNGKRGTAGDSAAQSVTEAPVGPQALVLSPTRELAAQIARVLEALLPGTRLHASLLTKSTAAGTDFCKVDVLVATPLLVGGAVAGGRLALGSARHVVLDEGDRLLDDQFLEQVDAVLAVCTSPHLVRSLFSASLSEAVEGLARSMMHDPVRVTVGERGSANASVHQSLQFVGSDQGRLLALRRAIAGGLTPPVLVFVSSKERAAALARDLILDNIPADAITADQGQAARKTAIEKFRSGQTWVLVSTDLLARGIDFVLSTVLSYDMPASGTDYIHRVGRTGRAGRTGTAITYFTEEDLPNIKPIANLIQAAGGDVPEFIRTTAKFERQPQRPKKRKSAPAAAGNAAS